MVEAVSTSSSRGGQVPPPRGNFDVRVDALAPGVLYLASGADQDGVVSSAFLHVRDKHLSYDLPALKGAQAPSNPDTWRELCKSSIFWLQSDALQLDDEAHVDASWAAESIEVARELRALAGAEVPGGNPADCDAARVNGPYPPSANFRVLDLAAGVGGNLVYFGLDSYLAVGVELNPARVAICRNNVAAYGLSNTHVVEGDLFEFAEQFAEDPSAKVAELGLQSHFPDPPMFDCVHISPPWGGKLYSGASDDGLFMLQRTFDVGRAMLSMAKIAHMVSLYLPRSQSVHEIVSLAALGGFPLVLIAAYHTTKKVRCIHAHFVRRVECFAHLQLHNMERLFVPYKPRPHGLSLLVQSTSYTLRTVELRSALHMDFVLHAVMRLLDEKSPVVALKLHRLLRLHPLLGVVALANQAREIQHAGGMAKVGSDEKRTTGGVFFHLLKTQHRELYRQVEKPLPAPQSTQM